MRSYIYPMTDGRRAGIEKEEYIEFIKGVKWQNLDNKVLAQVVAVLEQKESDG